MKFLSLTLFTFFIAMGVQAQKSSFGVKAGVTFFDQRGDDVVDDATENRQGGSFGLQYAYSSSENFGIGVEANYIAKGSKTAGEVADGGVTLTKLDYLELPILANVYFGSTNFKPKVFLGPTFGFVLKADQDIKGGKSRSIEDGLNSFELGATAGAGFNYQIMPGNWITFDARYAFGLTDVGETGDNKNRGLGINVGFTFPIGSAE